MGNKSALQLEVEKEMGFEIDEDLFAYLEHYARRKLEVANKSAGRAWGEDGYGDEYLLLLIPDVIREMAFSAYCDKRSAENLAARKPGSHITPTNTGTHTKSEKASWTSWRATFWPILRPPAVYFRR